MQRFDLVLLSLLSGCFGFLEVNLVLEECNVLLVALQPGLCLSNLSQPQAFSNTGMVSHEAVFTAMQVCSLPVGKNSCSGTVTWWC